LKLKLPYAESSIFTGQVQSDPIVPGLLLTPLFECDPGRRKLAVKVVDIFGNDTMTIVDVSVGKNGGKK
jgi:hypothetical protein